ncbi:TonB-dependent receptor [Desulfosarcina ovata subsp. sediminis]|uniref:TonB-dependent receptor n=1 Tax=Desulfosarcina ovata subsp. sediminis TaxID=885957 RepID=A0A5K7ZJG7_9BACT|nr:TonB-dependent receptor [Desulfosarcina ovata subsp. sediminis]
MTFQSIKLSILCILSVSLAFSILTKEVNADESETYRLDEITVTANKHEEKIQEIPASISVFTAIDLEDANITTLSDLMNLVPNLKANDNNGIRDISFRGLGSSRYTFKNPVTIYIDGVPSDKVLFTDIDFNNVERVEVLRGAQGVLYGKNSIGGIINVITKPSGNAVEGKINTEFAEHQTYGAKGCVNAPLITNRLYLSLSDNYRKTDGYMTNDHPDEDTYGGYYENSFRTRMNWLPTDMLEMDFNASLYKYSGDHTSTIYGNTNEVVYHSYKDPDDELSKDSLNLSMSINYSFEKAELKIISTYTDAMYDRFSKRLYEGASMIDGGMKLELDTFTQEVRIQSAADNSFKWMAGLFYSNEDIDNKKQFAVYDTHETLGYDKHMNWPTKTYEDTIAAFGEVTLPFGRFNLTTGIRYERTDAAMDYRYEESRADTGALVKDPVTYHTEDDWDVLIPKGVLSWQYSDNCMIYASIAKGYLAGGYNLAEADADYARIDNQTSINYEAGFKTMHFGNRIMLNAAIYYMDIKDIHVLIEGIDTGTFIASNAGAAHSQGIEIESVFNVMKGLDLMASFGIIDGEYDEYLYDKNTDYSGNKLIRTPEYSFNVGISYRHDSGLFARADVCGYGDTYFNPGNTKKQSSYEIYNVKIGYKASSWEVYGYGKNIFDEEYFTNMDVLNTVGAPSTFGIIATLTY